MTFTYRYCRMLEEGSFRGKSSDFIMMFLFGGALMSVSSPMKFNQIFIYYFFFNMRFSISVYLDICILCEFIVFGTSIHHHAGVRLVTTKSLHSDEFLWHSQLFGTVFAVGAAWILRDIRQCHLGGLDWYGSRSYLLFLGRCLSKATRWFSYTQDAIILVSSWPSGRWHLMKNNTMFLFTLSMQTKAIQWDSRWYQLLTTSRRSSRRLQLGRRGCTKQWCRWWWINGIRKFYSKW